MQPLLCYTTIFQVEGGLRQAGLHFRTPQIVHFGVDQHHIGWIIKVLCNFIYIFSLQQGLANGFRLGLGHFDGETLLRVVRARGPFAN